MNKALKIALRVLGVVAALYMLYAVCATIYDFNYSNEMDIGIHIAGTREKQFEMPVFMSIESRPITINLDRKVGQPVRLSFHLVPKLQ